MADKNKIYFAEKKFDFRTNKDLEKYYENMWKKGKYKGFKKHGINLSIIFDKNRKNVAIEFLSPKKNEIILDAGCGDGKFSIKISKKAKLIYGIDISKNAFKETKKKAPKNVIFKKAELEKLPFENNYFDKIVCIETLEHVIDLTVTLNEFHRVLKSKGKLIITYPTKSFVSKISDFFRPKKKFIFAEHLTNYSYGKLKKKIKKINFKILKVKGLFFHMPFQSKFRRNKKELLRTIKIQTSIHKGAFNHTGVAILAEKN